MMTASIPESCYDSVNTRIPWWQIPVEISLDRQDGRYQIQAYSDQGIRINGVNYQEAILLSLEHLQSSLKLQSSAEVTLDHLKQWQFEQFDVVIFGTGKNLNYPSWELLEQAQMAGTPLEVMATDAACRTFTALASEGRKLLAILFP